MSSPQKTPRSSPEAEFEAYILREIESGRLKPGDRLPSTAELATRHQLTVRRVQAALSTIAAQGFLERKPRRGTVVLHPPAKAPEPSILFLTGWNLEQEPSYMLRSLVHHLREVLAAKGYRLVVKHDLHTLFTGDEGSFRTECARLKAELEAAQPVAVLEYQFSLKRLSSIYPDFALPTVTLASAESSGDIEYDREHFMSESLRALRESGCKRLLMIRKGVVSESSNPLDAAFWRYLKRLRFRRGEIREIFHRHPAVALERAAEELLLDLASHWRRAPKSEIPDGLLVQDDIMMRGIATGLLKAALPNPPKIVHIANEGITHHYGIPTIRYELPVETLACEIVALLLQRLRRLGRERSGKPIRVEGRIVPTSPAPPPSAVSPLTLTSFESHTAI